MELSVDQNPVILTGENPFMKLSANKGKDTCDFATFWRILWSPAGAGCALYLRGELTDNEVRIYSDNVGLARWLQANVEKTLNPFFADPALPVIDAEFDRTGDARSTLVERITTTEDEVVIAWYDFAAPFVVRGAPDAKKGALGFNSTFIPARGSQLTFNGLQSRGSPWPDKIGGYPSSSSALAWSETWLQKK